MRPLAMSCSVLVRQPGTRPRAAGSWPRRTPRSMSARNAHARVQVRIVVSREPDRPDIVVDEIALGGVFRSGKGLDPGPGGVPVRWSMTARTSATATARGSPCRERRHRHLPLTAELRHRVSSSRRTASRPASRLPSRTVASPHRRSTPSHSPEELPQSDNILGCGGRRGRVERVFAVGRHEGARYSPRRRTRRSARDCPSDG